MANLLRFFALSRVARLVVACSLAIGLAGAVFLGISLPRAHAFVQVTDPVLIIHGYNGSTTYGASNGFDCGAYGQASGAEAATMFSYVSGSPQVTVLGYYKGDTNCTMLSSESSHCDYYLFSGANPSTLIGTNNEDVRHIGCELDWYIWDNYTSHGRAVRIVAHSMGGLIVRWGIFAVQAAQTNPSQYPNLPSYLYVPGVVTLGTPHIGVPGAANYCAFCTQGEDLQFTTYNGFESDLLSSNGLDPQARTSTTWTAIGSYKDDVITVGGYEQSNYTSAFWMDADQMYFYSYGSDTPVYNHDELFQDMSTASDASYRQCFGCTHKFPDPTTWNHQSSVLHTLCRAIASLLYTDYSCNVNIPPTPTPTSTPSPICSATHPPCNWVGWESTAWNAYQFAKTSFVVPNIPVRNYSGMTMWVGYNGDPNEVPSSNGYFVREGVDASVDDVGDVAYAAFWSVESVSGQVIASNSDFYSPNPGDQVNFNVWYDGSNIHFDFYDTTTKAGQSNAYPLAGFREYTTDWIVSDEARYLTDWNGTGFAMFNCVASPDNANWYPITHTSNYSDTMHSLNTAAVMATPGSLYNGGTAFQPTWVRAN